MSSPWIFISPSTRGIGFALTRHLLKTTSLPVLATARPHHDPSDVKTSLLQGLATPNISDDALRERLSVLHVDVTDEKTLQAAAAKAKELFPPDTHHLRLACAIPGILHAEKSLKQVTYDNSLESFQINTLGPLFLMKHFSAFLPKGATDLKASPSSDAVQLPAHATWLSMAARVGSTTGNGLGGWFSYRASKAGVISIAKTLDLYLRAGSGDKAVSVAYHPGTVKTELSREFWDSVKKDKLFSPEFAAEKLVELVTTLQVEQRGRCWDWKGEEVPP
ncbi:hypothetical protein B0T10DRAFT_489563 [Thelonectria olida]|uniref:NAD(P)-binding protein n=1 Tax=Thelonectria olida TaxID=1576542 RepID=A0A9P9API4_9HYPO|nr:hypothetical protein B0T10DRAFT_489563 [Thelonectria olida]